MSDQGGCSCVQDISVTSCEENIMFWEVSGIGTEVIGLLWNLPFLEYATGLFFLGLFLPFIVLSGSLLLSACSCYLPTLVYLTLSLVLQYLVSESGS